jgi:hypothetical protein
MSNQRITPQQIRNAAALATEATGAQAKQNKAWWIWRFI